MDISMDRKFSMPPGQQRWILPVEKSAFLETKPSRFGSKLHKYQRKFAFDPGYIYALLTYNIIFEMLKILEKTSSHVSPHSRCARNVSRKTNNFYKGISIFVP
jgi:hypothetical protein